MKCCWFVESVINNRNEKNACENYFLLIYTRLVKFLLSDCPFGTNVIKMGAMRFVNSRCVENGLLDKLQVFKINFICRLMICQKFMTCAICCNVVFLRRAMTTVLKRRMSEGLRVVASTERPPAEKPALFSSCYDVFDKL